MKSPMHDSIHPHSTVAVIGAGASGITASEKLSPIAMDTSTVRGTTDKGQPLRSSMREWE